MTPHAHAWRHALNPTALAFVVTVLATTLGLLAPVDQRLHDALAGLTRDTVASDLVIVEIDAQSLRALPAWPWPRRDHARLLERLHAAGVADVFYDVDFSSPSNPSDDHALARAVALFPRDRIMLPGFVQPGTHASPSGLVVATPLPILRQASTLVSVNMTPDGDGLIRRMTSERPIGTTRAPLAGIQMLGRAPATETFVLDYRVDPRSFTRVSFHDVLAGTIDSTVFRGKHVMVGATAIELGDMLPVPVYRALPGVVVQAVAYQTLAQGAPGTAPAWLVALGLLALAALLALVFRTSNWRRGLPIVAALALTVIGIAGYARVEWRAMLPMASPLFLMATGFAFHLVSRLEQQHLKLLLQAFHLRRQDALMASVVDHSLDAILATDAQGQIHSANPASVRMFGHDVLALVGMRVTDLIAGIDPGRDWSELSDATGRATHVTREHTGRRFDGQTFPVEVVLSRFAFEGETLFTIFARDISERHAQRADLEHQATHDALTGLANRYLLRARLDALETSTQANRYALLLIDLDKFKEINDSLGHAVGDRILVEVAARFTATTDPGQVLTRLGGDEFAVLVPLTAAGEDEARALAARLHAALIAPFEIDDMSLEIAASVGIAVFPDHAGQATVLLQHADTAMYHAKRSGTGTALYETRLTESSALRMTISTGLRQAMRDAQLAMHYQPKLTLATKTVTSLEALLRWTHPQLGRIPPDRVVDVAEQTGLIWPLTEWTLEQALSDCARWRAAGHGVRVAVNLSARLLHDASLLARVQTCLKRTQADPAWLMLEITESAILGDPARALDNARELSALGIELSLDDFGTGYSSLSYLRNLPADELKIDKSFIVDLPNRPEDTLIVESTIRLAHTLGLTVVAEGVETAAVMDALQSLGCDLIQGYGFSRPLPADEIEARLGDWTGEQAREPHRAARRRSG